jgi:CheY-like chemotaxis protein
MTRVLIADDDRDTREAMRFLLEDAGYEVVEAPDGTTALDMLRTSRHRLVVLLDWMMPGMGGAEVLSAVAGDGALSARHAYVLVTASPAYVSTTVVELASALAVPVVPKPFDVEVLLEVVAAAAGRLTAAEE